MSLTGIIILLDFTSDTVKKKKCQKYPDTVNLTLANYMVINIVS